MNTQPQNTLACLEYFHDLWLRLQQLLSERRQQKLSRQREFKKICGAVEAIVEGTDARLRGVCNYQKQLREGACNLLQYVEGLVDSMPEPIVVDDNALVCDPLVRTLLSDTRTIRRLFMQNKQVQAYFDSLKHTDSTEMFAILYLHRKEKSILGSEIHGQILMREVRQTALCFYGHRLLAPSPNEEVARIEMIIDLFETVVRYIKNRLLEHKKLLMQAQTNPLLSLSEGTVNNPEIYINILVEQLEAPEKLITLQDNLVRLNSLGIKLPLESDSPSNLLRLNDIEVGDHHPRTVSLIRYPRHGLSERFIAEQAILLADEFNNPSCPFSL